MRSCPLFACIGFVFLLSGTSSAEPNKRECVDAATQGQDLRDGGHLVRAREAFAVCVAPSCPTVVRKSCGEWLLDLDARIPKIAVRVVGADDHDVPDVRVRIDEGTSAAAYASMALDPGPHTVTVEAPGERVTERIVVAERESRTVVVHLRGPASPREPLASAEPKVSEPTPPVVKRAADAENYRPPSPQTSRGSEGGAVPATAWVLGGVAIAGFGSFAFFGLSARSDLADLRSSCAPDCAPSSRDAAHDKAMIADVSLGVALVATIATAVILATRH